MKYLSKKLKIFESLRSYLHLFISFKTLNYLSISLDPSFNWSFSLTLSLDRFSGIYEMINGKIWLFIYFESYIISGSYFTYFYIYLPGHHLHHMWSDLWILLISSIWADPYFQLLTQPNPTHQPNPSWHNFPELNCSELYWFQTDCFWSLTDLSVIKTSGEIQVRILTISKSRSRFQTPVRNPQRPPKPQMRT